VRGIRVWARLLGLRRTVVEDVTMGSEGEVIVSVRSSWRERDRCGICRRHCPGYDLGEGRRRWRALDLGTSFCFLEADAPRVRCRRHGVVVVAVPWARHDSRLTRAFEDQVVRHEALLDRVGCKTPRPGCRGSMVNRGQPGPWRGTAWRWSS
jgi:transposase